ncbi:hypothetical protein oki361_21990 [Helicobacter pylori]
MYFLILADIDKMKELKKEIKNTFLKIAKTLGNQDFIFPLEIQQGHRLVQNNNTYKQNKDKIKGFKLI